MSNRSYFLLIVLATILVIRCTSSDGSKLAPSKADSIELTSLVRNVYEWHEIKYRTNGFPFKLRAPNDSIFTGVDWEAYVKDIEVLKKTNFFSNDFFVTHRTIALSIDSSINQASIEWRNINDGIPLWDTDADDWCGCQDYPDNYWKLITLHDLKFSKDTVSFKWTWGNKNGIQPNEYEMKARKENGTWKISYIEGFTYYGSVDHYKKIMNHEK